MYHIRLLPLLYLLFFVNAASSQSKQWDKKFGYFEYDLVATNQLVDSQSNHYVLGTFKGVHDISGNLIATRGDADNYLVKYNPSHQVEWVRTFGSAASDNSTSMSCDKSGNLYITGAFYGSTFYASATDSLKSIANYSQTRYLIKFDNAGSVQWTKRFSATSSVSDQKSELLNDLDGRLYLIVPNRAAGTPTSWQFQDSMIFNPGNPAINTPRWAMCRINEANGKLVWLNYIANPRISANIITYLNISAPKLDSRNNILFAITQWGNHIDSIYIFGKYAPLSNGRTNNILVRVDSSGTVTKFRDLGLNNSSTSEASEIALTSDNMIALINKSAQGSENGINYNYTTNPSGFNYLRLYDTSFSLTKIVRLGQQDIKSFLFDSQNRLVTMGASKTANYNQPAVDETLQIDSIQSIRFNTASQIFPYFTRYSNNFKFDTFYLENHSLPYIAISLAANSLKIASNGDIYPILSYPTMNMAVFRYDSLFKTRNSKFGKIRDREDQFVGGIAEDAEGNIYGSGLLHGKTFFQNALGKDSLLMPFENSYDCFLTKFDKSGNLLWIKTFGSSLQDYGRFIKINKTGVYVLLQSGPTISQSEWNLTADKKVIGNQVLMKFDFNGNLLWHRGIYSLNLSSPPDFNILKSLANGDLMVGIKGQGDVYFGEEKFAALGNKYGQIIGVIDSENGSIKKYNRFALRIEADGNISSATNNAYEDPHGNLYLAMQSNYTGNLNAASSQNELYSFKQKAVSFSHVWVSQSSLLKLDSSLEIAKFNQFVSYMYLSDIAGSNNSVYVTGRAKNRDFNFGDTTIPLFSYALAKHFTNFVGVLDTALKFKQVAKMDTLTLENQVNLNSSKLLVDPISKNVYNTFQFTGSIALKESLIKINSNGGNDILFVKYDSSGNLIGGQHLGTPQNDFFTNAFLDKSSNIIFSSQAVDPNYNSRIFTQASPNNPFSTGPPSDMTYGEKKNSLNNFSTIEGRGARQTGLDAEGNVVLPAGINKDILSPDSYLSKYTSLKEIGRGPDTTTIELVNPIFCKGDSAMIRINDATSIQWKKNGTPFNGFKGATVYPKESGDYYAVITTVEGRTDSSRVIAILAKELPSQLESTSTNYCLGQTSSSLSATATPENELLWYSSSTGSNFSATAPVPSTAAIGSIDYYVSQKNILSGCIGPRVKVTAIINGIPSVPTVAALAYCQSATAVPLLASSNAGNSLLWYGSAAAGGTASIDAPTPSTVSVGAVDYYVSQKNIASACESPRVKIQVTINALPSPPTAANVNYCSNVVATALSATIENGTSLLWYGINAIGGIPAVTAPIPSTSIAGVVNYYVSQKITATGCEGPRTKIIVNTTATPPAPIVSDVNYCIGSQANRLSATAVGGNNLLWYTNATGGTSVATSSTPSTTAIGKTDFFVSQSTPPLGCEGPRAKITVTIYPIPAMPTISRRNDSLVSSSPIGNVWLKDGALLPVTTQTVKPLTAGNYFVTAIINGCSSPMSSAYYSLLTTIANLNNNATVKAAPNPFTNQLYLDFIFNNNQKVNVEIFETAHGKKVYTKQNLLPGTPLYLGHLFKGTYLIKVTTPDNTITTQFKIVKM